MAIERNPNLVQQSDEELMTSFYAGDDDAFCELVRRHRQSLIKQAIHRLSGCRAARHEIAEDMVQLALMDVMRTKGSHTCWNAQRGSVLPWLRRILRNRVVSFQRSSKHQVTLESDLCSGSQSDGLALQASQLRPHDRPGNTEFEQAELEHLLQRAIHRLPVQHHAILRLSYWHGLSLLEVGGHVGLSPATVCRRLSDARDQLRAEMTRYRYLA